MGYYDVRDTAPCPFCGWETPEIKTGESAGAMTWLVVCPSCGGAGPERNTEKRAIKAWATRPIPAEKEEA